MSEHQTMRIALHCEDSGTLLELIDVFANIVYGIGDDNPTGISGDDYYSIDRIDDNTIIFVFTSDYSDDPNETIAFYVGLLYGTIYSNIDARILHIDYDHN